VRRYPVFNTHDTAYGLMTDSGGVLFADAILADLAASLRARGATLVERFAADTVDVSAAHTRSKDGRQLQGDVLIAAAGIGVGALFGEHLSERFTPMRSIVLYIEPPLSWLPHLRALPCWLSLGGEGDLWGAPPIDSIPMKIGCGGNTRPGDPAQRRVSASEIESILALYRSRLADFGTARPILGIANFWTKAPAGRFVFRRIERCYVVAACSGHGFKFGPLTGQDVAEAITTGHVATASRRLAGLAA
jgi:glycine/D-amino acid oxidase-like deaminating enzyme